MPFMSTRAARLSISPDNFTLSADSGPVTVQIDTPWSLVFARSGSYVTGALLNTDNIDHLISYSRTQTFDSASSEIRNAIQTVTAGESFMMDNNFAYGSVCTMDTIAVYDWTAKTYYIVRIFAHTDSDINYVALRLEHMG